MIEALKQALEALEDVGVLTDREWQAVHKNKANELRQAIREHAMYEVQRLGQEIEQEPVAFAGVEMWIGNTRIKKLMTQAELHYAIDPWAIVKFHSDSCIDALKEKNNG
jgi:hypothetical protein